jgi:hypothetical protein
MGQDFCLAAPRANKALTPSGRLREILLGGGGAKDLVRLLAVPVRPQNLLCVSEAPPVTPTKSQSACYTTEKAAGNSVQDEIIPTVNPRRAKRKRKADCEVLSARHQKRAKTESRNSDDAGDRSYASIFSSIPVEMHRLIFSCIEFIEDVICLSVTSKYFWSIGREYIHDHYASFLGLWAGENIVCVGEEVEPGDFPPGLFTMEEENELRQKSIVYDSYQEEDPQPLTLHHFTRDNVTDLDTVAEIEETVDVHSESQSTYHRCVARSNHWDAAFKCLDSEICVRESKYYPEDQPWILRNLTTKEFVRSEAIALRPEYIRGPRIEGLGFGEVVVSRISWSTSSFVNLIGGSEICRGVWAGHRFDITTLARHVEETKGGEWRDVSEEVAREIAGIWEDQYGPDWRRIHCENVRIRW